MLFHRCSAILLVCGLLVATGCKKDDPVVLAKGKIVKGGQPLTVKAKGPTPPGTRNLVVELIAEDGRSEPVGVDEDNSSFTVLGATGKGAKPGKYKLVVYFYDPAAPNDQLKGAFNPQNTKITLTLEAGKDLGTIDLDNPPK
jgi:hypothetical protein